MPDPMSSTEASRVRRPGFDSKSPPAEPSGRSWRLWSVLPVCAGFAVFGVVVWMAYQDASLGPPGGEPPLIRAAPEAIKLPPDQAEEAALAAEQDEVGQLWSDAEQDQPERLLPLPEQPLTPPAGEPSATSRTACAAVGRGSAPGSRRCRPDAASAQPATDQSLPEAEAALDRLLAEVTAVSEGAGAPGASAAKPAEDTNGPGGSCRSAVRERRPPPWRLPTRRRRSPNPPATTAAAPPAIPPAPPAPPQKPAAPAATAAAGADVRPAGAIGGAATPRRAAAGSFDRNRGAQPNQGAADRDRWRLPHPAGGSPGAGGRPACLGAVRARSGAGAERRRADFRARGHRQRRVLPGPDRPVRQTGGGGEPVRTAQAA